ncbi:MULTISPECIES: hypothetical protein [unclassified Burkholderia]|uniref:hypothetical protein n=1 Tax=unclassified Burkholderia TaxID=2613784 RepID=UPI000F55DBAC|nr:MULTISPECIES: hypothetical protein [unclassified Burkholderia]RQS26840.1 hypothetical protein DIE05_20450 [Burkholderia sp. Bp8995]RQS51726.1 hypothetical protein DIE00_03090 [Burkholderia sp. Bp8989]
MSADIGVGVVAIGRGALAKPDWPAKVPADVELLSFDQEILRPIANIKDSEIAMQTGDLRLPD